MKKVRTLAHKSQELSKLETENRKLAYTLASESVVLLKNDGTLPLKEKNIALYGSGAKMTIKGGTGSGEVNERYSVTIYDGLMNKDCKVNTEAWLQRYEELYTIKKDEYISWAKKKLKFFLFNPLGIQGILENSFIRPFDVEVMDNDLENSNTDTCVYIVSRQSGEGGDRKIDRLQNNLSESEKANIVKCAKFYKNMILVINTGHTFDLSFVEEVDGINAVLFYNQQGTEGGNALADILYGDTSPSGKLSVTWAKKYEDYPFANEYSFMKENLDNEEYREDIYVGYRYFDSFKVNPQFEFGFGLSYASFDIESKAVYVNETKVSIEYKVKNISKRYSGKEVVQLYVSSPINELHKEYQSLIAYKKSLLINKNSTLTDGFEFDIRSLASYDESISSYVLDAGDYILRLGNSSRNTKIIGVLSLNKRVIVSKHKSIENAIQIKGALKSYDQDKVEDDVQRLNIDSDVIKTTHNIYKKPTISTEKSVQEMLSKFNISEMIDIVVGTGIFASPYFDVPGSVGNTTSKYSDRGLINMVLSDGPAGIRINRTSGLSKKGSIKPIDPFIEILDYIPNYAKKFIFANKNKDKILYQFTTAFPVGMALAQTWNNELLYKFGKAIERESNKYGITYWLGPAMNIHRNPLCGRNFEYFSEDPLLSGKTAAVITKGYQERGGNYVTLKHFVANNQEDNRKQVSSNISERALREIYLRGFEIAVKEGKAKSVMTGYNKVNGKYVFEDYNLCTNILRNEWGFDGVVMSDWFSTIEGNPALTMSAGNDLIMPGTRKDKKAIKKALKAGVISEDDIKRCTANILKSYLECNFKQSDVDIISKLV